MRKIPLRKMCRSFGASIHFYKNSDFASIYYDKVMNIGFEVVNKNRKEIADSIKKYENAVLKYKKHN